MKMEVTANIFVLFMEQEKLLKEIWKLNFEDDDHISRWLSGQLDSGFCCLLHKKWIDSFFLWSFRCLRCDKCLISSRIFSACGLLDCSMAKHFKTLKNSYIFIATLQKNCKTFLEDKQLRIKVDKRTFSETHPWAFSSVRYDEPAKRKFWYHLSDGSAENWCDTKAQWQTTVKKCGKLLTTLTYGEVLKMIDDDKKTIHVLCNDLLQAHVFSAIEDEN